MSWEDDVADDWEAEVAGEGMVDNWEDEAAMLFDKNTVIDKRVEEYCPICHGEGKVTEEEKIRVEDRMKAKAEKTTTKKYDENKGVIPTYDDTPLDDPIAEKARLKQISERSDAMIFEQELFSGQADDAFISETEKAVGQIPLRDITDYQQLAYKLGKKMQEINNQTSMLEFLQCCVRQIGTCLTADDLTKLANTCNVVKEDKKREQKAAMKKTKKKGKTTATIKVSGDTWQDQMDDTTYGGYDDDFM